MAALPLLCSLHKSVMLFALFSLLFRFFCLEGTGNARTFLFPPSPRLLCRQASPQLPLANSTARLETPEDRAELCRNVWVTRAKLICLTLFQYVRLSVSHCYGKSRDGWNFIDLCWLLGRARQWVCWKHCSRSCLNRCQHWIQEAVWQCRG